MANRIVGNVVIVDSAMGNAFVLNSANAPTHITNFKINSIEFLSNDTTGLCVFTDTNTTNVVKVFRWMANGAGAGLVPATQTTDFAQPQYLYGLKIPVLTAGTAWIYLA